MSEQAVAESASASASAASSQPTIIECKGLGKTYVSGKLEVRALHDVDLHVLRNEFVAIMGPSGSGKSTLMNLLGCLDTPTFGSYRLNQTEVANLDDDELAAIRNQEIGFIFQTFNLLARATALHNVELPLIYAGMSSRKRHERAMNALERVGLGNRWNHRPSELSGGERQRVAVARALVNRPGLLLCDEPTGSLDQATATAVGDLLCELHDESTILVVVTHSLELAERFARRVELRAGICVEL